MNLRQVAIEELRKKTLAIAFVFGFILLAKVILLCLPFLMKVVVDSLIDEPTWATEFQIYPPLIVVAYAAAFFLASLFEEAKEYLSEKTVQPAIAQVAQKTFCLIQQLPMSFYLDSTTGGLLRNFDRMVRALQSLSSLVLYTVVPLSIEIAAILLIFFINYDLKYGAIIFVGVLVHAIITLSSTPGLVKERKNLNVADTRVSGFIGESIMNFESIKLLGTAKKENLRFGQLFHLYVLRAIRFQFLHSRLKVIQNGVISLTLGFLMWNAASDVMIYKITTGDFVLINAFALQVLIPISTMGILWKEIHQSLADVKSLGPIIEATPLQTDVSDRTVLRSPPKIEFRNVSVRYGNGKHALQGISFIAMPGTFTVITGENGAGKTTILKLLAGLVEPTSGKILINDEPKTSKELISMISAVGFVPQFVNLFQGSIAHNLTYGLDDTSMERARELAKLVKIEKMVDEGFPNGFETLVGERGQKLSGGERAKIGLARALAKDPKLLVLDEPTSSLDQESQRQFLDVFSELSSHKTVIMITHSTESLKGNVHFLRLFNGRLIHSAKSQTPRP